MTSIDISRLRVPQFHGVLFTKRPAHHHLQASSLSQTGQTTLPSSGKATVGATYK
ncbi:hypothetical protein DPMN_159672 [Dreissena polymorpha]|uniref:Uncharacterized protein n=1 Tax=Dreissena polymorpha TaxID=45954 RepID=A0A9D4EM30_DREPO|nr:hypothetical protein DPMN_159672 [Dreissena polymorpha]